VAARVARAGATPYMNMTDTEFLRDLGIERLDRIQSQVGWAYEAPVKEDTYGLRRGCDNWRFPWLPVEWTSVPITWDHLVENVLATHPELVAHPTRIGSFPMPLRQHLAQRLLHDRTNAQPPGTEWCVARSPPTSFELRNVGVPLNQQVHAALFASPRHVWADAPEALVKGLAEGHRVFAWSAVVSGTDPFLHTAAFQELAVHGKLLVRDANGTWYEPSGVHGFLKRSIPQQRRVSAALSTAQSHQLLTAFYLVEVERVDDPVIAHAAGLVLFTYMIERGYTARWMGKYKQCAFHVGNGDRLRNFNALPQYKPHHLPSRVLNRICKRDGSMRVRGSKGSRSKYRADKYEPQRRLRRSDSEEEAMARSHGCGLARRSSPMPSETPGTSGTREEGCDDDVWDAAVRPLGAV
jgi:hypothetical protein